MGFIGKTRSSQANKATPFSMANSLPVQTKLTVSKSSDRAEKEADTVARKVVDEQKDKKSAAAMPVSENTPETKDKDIKTKEDKDKKDIGRKEEPKKEIKKKSEQKEEKKAARKEVAGDQKEKIAKQVDKKKDIQKKSEQKEEKKIGKKAEGKEETNKEKKPVDKEKDISVRPKPINLKASAGKEEKPAIDKKPEEKTPVNALGKKEGEEGTQPEQKNGEVEDEAKLQALEEKINARRGKGKPLDSQVKAEMDQSFSHDFSDVRVNDDKESAELCASLNAQAFAIGNDIFFNTGKYNPESSQGKELLAHELTHVVQQGASGSGFIQRQATEAMTSSESSFVAVANRSVIQRAGVKNAGEKNPHKGTKVGNVERDGNKYKLEVNKIKLPKFKADKKGNKVLEIPKEERDNKQIEKWEAGIIKDYGSEIDTKVKKLIAKTSPIGVNKDIYAFKYGEGRLIGKEDEIKKKIIRPFWDKSSKSRSFHVDHIHEFQIGGKDDYTNFWLLDAKINIASGKVIKKEKEDKVNALINEASKESGFWPKKKPSYKTVREGVKNGSYTVNFLKIEDNLGGVKEPDEEEKYEKKDIIDEKSLNALKPLDNNDLKELGVAGDSNDVTLFLRPQGGIPQKLKNGEGITIGNIGIDPIANTVKRGPNNVIQDGSKIRVKLFKGIKSLNNYLKTKNGEEKTFLVNVYSMQGLPNVGYLKSQEWSKEFKEKIKMAGLSPIDFQQIDLDDSSGIVIRAKILPSVPVIANADIEFVIRGNEFYLEKTFTAEEFNIPSPFKIDGCSLTIRAGTIGLELEGNLNFGIEKVGEGSITGSVNSAGLFRLAGDFNFDEKLFGGVKANAGVSYEHKEGVEDKWDVNGNIKIPPNKIKGIKEAEIKVSYADKIFRADGTAKFDIPGLEDGKLNVTYANEQLIIEGEANFKHKLIKSGNVKAKVETVGETTNVSLSGKLQPNIPGVETDLSVDYIDGILTISGTVAYNKGRLSGSVTVGVTNQAVGVDGKPSGTGGKSLTAFGGGSLTLKITDWLQGTAGVMLKPDGSIEVVGKIGIPGTVDIFPKKEINKPIFKAPTIEIPLFAIPVGSHSIGLVATIGGGADAYASIGPGQLTEAAVEVTYNPSHEEDMKVSGNAKFRVPAEAGLRLYVRAGIGLSIGIARVSGGIELGGALGIEGAAEAGVQVNWSPAQGFKLDAEASIYVQPKFKFDVNAYIEAVLDLWVTEFSKEWKWNLYAFEYGPALRFGVKFPVHYEENKPFEISLNDVQFETPEINVGDFAKGIGKQLVG